MNKKDVRDFFDKHAELWDANMIRHDDVINEILNNTGICDEISVLDVACGTGVLFSDYSRRNAAKVSAFPILSIKTSIYHPFQ